VESREAWRGTGMRGSTSGPVEIDAVVEDGALMGTPSRANEYITTEMFNLLLLSHAALYSGVANEALALAIEHANVRRFGHTGELLGEMSLWQSRLGELSAELAACRALIRETAHAVETLAERRLLKEALAAKLTACGVARQATDLALQISGGSGYNIGQRVEMLWRDARAGSLMRPSDEVAALLLGRLEREQEPFRV
jgi:alkylation response protein AidB-like acyl-CoA dehydrogenase